MRGQTGALVNISENLLPEPAEHWLPILKALALQLGGTPPVQPEPPDPAKLKPQPPDKL